MKKEIEVKFSEEAYKEYKVLQESVAEGKQAKKKPTYEQLLTSINNALRNIKADYKYGDLIPRDLIPKEYKQKYDAANLFIVDLPDYWRMIYTLESDEIEIIAFILEYMDHDRYNKLFGYRKK